MKSNFFFNPRESIICMIKQSFSYLIIPVCPKDFHRSCKSAASCTCPAVFHALSQTLLIIQVYII
jgi:hypothetical protein